MTEEHMPGCAALLCQYRHEFMVAHCLGEKIVHRKGGSCAGHKFQPGTCNCELGRLRAENEKLQEKFRKSDLVHGEEMAALERERDRYYEAIKNAPCGFANDTSFPLKGIKCDVMGGAGPFVQVCTCWKRKALEEQPDERG